MHTFNFNCFFDDFNCVFTQIRYLSRLLDSVITSALYFRKNKHYPPSLIGLSRLLAYVDKYHKWITENHGVHGQYVLLVGLHRKMRMPGYVCNVIFGLPEVISDITRLAKCRQISIIAVSVSFTV